MKFAPVLLLATLSLISGHVSITPNQIPSGGTTIINFQLSHGCNATTLTNKVVVRFPSNITNMKPVDKVGWKLSRTSELLGYKINGVDAFYYNFTWEVDSSIYQGLPDWAFDVLSVRVTLPAASAIAYGSKFSIPVWQYCTGGLVYAWVSGSSAGDSHGSEVPVNGVTISTAPSFTVLNPDDIQFIPSQANVKSLSDKITNLTTQVTAFQSRIITSKHEGEDHGVAVTINTNGNGTTSNNTTEGVSINHYINHTSADERAQVLSIIAIVLASISTTFMLLLGYKYHLVTSKNAKLLATVGTTTAPTIYTKDVELQPQQQQQQPQPQPQPGEPVPAASAPAPAPVTDTHAQERRNTSTPSTQHEGEVGTHAEDAHHITFHA